MRLKVEISQKHSTPWAEAGCIVSWSEKRIAQSPKKSLPSGKDNFSDKHLTADNKYIRYGTDSLEFIFDKTKGSVVCWTVDGNNLIESGTNNLTFWRAPTSRGDRFNAAYWKNYGLDAMVTSVVSTKLVENTSSFGRTWHQAPNST